MSTVVAKFTVDMPVLYANLDEAISLLIDTTMYRAIHKYRAEMGIDRAYPYTVVFGTPTFRPGQSYGHQLMDMEAHVFPYGKEVVREAATTSDTSLYLQLESGEGSVVEVFKILEVEDEAMEEHFIWVYEEEYQ